MQNNSFKKTINRLKLLTDLLRKKTVLSGMPIELVIEATNMCNLNCQMCVRKNMTRPIGYLNFNLYKKIIDQTAPFIELIYLHGEGEPLFHPRIMDMIKYAKSKNIEIGLSTNATLLTKEKAKDLIKSGLDYCIIALDATTAETYEKVRGKIFFDKVLKNTQEFLKIKKRSHLGKPFTIVQMVKTADNEMEADEFKSFWHNKGADVIRVKPVIDLLKENDKKKKFRRPCYYLWRQLNMISWNGEFVTPCCMDSEGEYSLGNINKQTIQEIWNGKPMVLLRKAQLGSAWKKVLLCQNCTYPQPNFLGRTSALILSEMTIKKLWPIVESLTFGKFVIND